MMNIKISLLIICTGVSFSLCAPIDSKEAQAALEGKQNIIHAAILGSGPTGFAASIPFARAGYRTIIFQGPKPGGELMDSAIVENWPGMPKQSGAQSMNELEKQALHFGALLDSSTITDIDLSTWPFKLKTSDGNEVIALTIIIATGASQKKLGIENEDVYWGRGLFSCGICDASFTQGKDAVVIGGGDIAIQRALQLAPQAKTVTLIVPGSRLTATESMQKKIRCLKHVSTIHNKIITKIEGDGNIINGIELKDTTTGELSPFKTQCIFLSTGLTPNTELFKGKLELDQFGCIKLKEGRTQETAVEGVMAAGNVADPRYRQVATIIGDGTKAAIDGLKLLSQWGFDGPLKELIQDRLYKPSIKYNNIKQIRSIPEFKNTIANAKNPVLVEFYSPLCSHCKNMEAPVAHMAEKFKNVLNVFKVNKDKLFKLIQMHKIEIIPAFIVFMNGKEVNRMEGETSQEDLIEFVEESRNLATHKKRSLCHPLEAPSEYLESASSEDLYASSKEK